jgi:hypothetical protein
MIAHRHQHRTESGSIAPDRTWDWAMMPNMTMTLGEGEPAAGPWQVVPLAQLVRMLRPRYGASSGRPWVLAVDGRSGSGKTTLAERIWGAVPASTVVHTDDVAWGQAMFDCRDGHLTPNVSRGCVLLEAVGPDAE